MVTLKDMIEQLEDDSIPKNPRRISFFEMLTPAFVGGLITGVIAGIPGINIIIPLLAIGGYVAARLVYDFYGKRLRSIDGIKVGAFAGFIGAFLGTLILMIIAAAYADGAFKAFKSTMDVQTAEFVLLLSGLDPYVSLITLRTRFIVNVVLCVLLGAIGGWIYAQRFVQSK